MLIGLAYRTCPQMVDTDGMLPSVVTYSDVLPGPCPYIKFKVSNVGSYAMRVPAVSQAMTRGTFRFQLIVYPYVKL